MKFGKFAENESKSMVTKKKSNILSDSGESENKNKVSEKKFEFDLKTYLPPEEIIIPKTVTKPDTVNIGLNMYFKKN